jgi:hypothetical protein
MRAVFYLRRAEIITIARRKGVADAVDLDRFLKAWFWHRPTSADQDPIGALIHVAWRMGRNNLTAREAKEPVPPERKQGDFQGGDCPVSTVQAASPTSLVLENGVLLTRRWIAARERLCGCRHNGRLYPDVCKEAAE